MYTISLLYYVKLYWILNNEMCLIRKKERRNHLCNERIKLYTIIIFSFCNKLHKILSSLHNFIDYFVLIQFKNVLIWKLMSYTEKNTLSLLAITWFGECAHVWPIMIHLDFPRPLSPFAKRHRSISFSLVIPNK